MFNKSESITKIAPAVIKFNSEVSRIEKDAENKFTGKNYATLDNIVEKIRPVLSANKLSVMQNVISNDGFMTVKTLLIHESGEWFESEGTTLKLTKNDPQGAGAGITYARRYDLCAFLSLNTGDDDDGESVSGDTPDEKPITQKQVGEIKVKVMQFAKARNRTNDEVYKALEIEDVTYLSEEKAQSILRNLDKWLEGVKKEQGSNAST
ncbi:ERF family protein [Oceanobacillus kimchii]|uniref:ERF family protein n=1 Tax=Oceanobacillus kimchii TaxID=746691 RepID=UPI0021A973CF|nr:ERF family protein [Oceanobacillus kimchii]MCT1575664.1 ERF family protein [Oceanobacillus kimchii]MCT2137295.1 ERF family protein [Oceanobacillus kimchii]